MVTDKQPSSSLTEQPEQRRPIRPPSLASLRCFPEHAPFDEISQVAQDEAVLIDNPEKDPLVLMPAAVYDHLTRRVDLLLSMLVENRETVRAAEPSNPDYAFQEDAEYWAALEQMARLDRQAHKWERTHGSDAGTLGAVFAKACQVFENVVPAIDWLSRPNALLGGAIPSRLIATDTGAQSVFNALGKIEHGIPM